jgi:hypothetical protein
MGFSFLRVRWLTTQCAVAYYCMLLLGTLLLMSFMQVDGVG